jgi:hypothetical protein
MRDGAKAIARKDLLALDEDARRGVEVRHEQWAGAWRESADEARADAEGKSPNARWNPRDLTAGAARALAARVAAAYAGTPMQASAED